MNKLTLKLETVTPLFLGGAEPRGEPELRPPAFRGAMRYWLRAALGGVIGDNDLTNLHKLETKVFGSTDGASPITIQLHGDPEKNMVDILPHKPGSGRRKAFKGGESFNLTLSAVRPVDETVWKNACMALNLAILFGGVGLRSRRGFGSLRITTTSEADLIPKTPTELDEWVKYIRVICRSAINQANVLATYNNVVVRGLPTGRTQFPCASTESIVRIPDTFGTDEALEILGLFMSRMPNRPFVGAIRPRRHASPLWVRTINADNEYRLLLCVLPCFGNEADLMEMKEFLNNTFPGKNIPIKGWNKNE